MAYLKKMLYNLTSGNNSRMEHKSWIKNYENNFEKLATEIGDLRYDALAEFLELLGQKIEQDGHLDRNRGRIKLANSLQNSAAALMESAANIKEAWSICEPYMFPKDISTKTEIKASTTVKSTHQQQSNQQ